MNQPTVDRVSWSVSWLHCDEVEYVTVDRRADVIGFLGKTCHFAMKPSATSTPDRSRIAQAAGLTPEQRLLAGFEHSEFAMRVVEDGIRDQNPQADDATIGRLLADRITLMRKLQNREVSEL